MTLTVEILEKKLTRAKQDLESAEADCKSTNAEIRMGGNLFAKAAREEVAILTLAKRGLATMPRPTHKHIKTGGLYTKIGDGRIQSMFSLHDMAKVVIYRSELDGSLWAREISEFNDVTRFEALSVLEQP